MRWLCGSKAIPRKLPDNTDLIMDRAKYSLPQFLIILVVLLTACNTPTVNPTQSPISTAEILPSSTLAPESTTTPYQSTETPMRLTISPTAPAAVTPTSPIIPSSTQLPTAKPTLSSARAPVIHDLPGDDYKNLFSISAGRRGILKYTIPTCCANIEGPNAIAVLSDETFLISDLLAGGS
jgi:hypothetical protein